MLVSLKEAQKVNTGYRGGRSGITVHEPAKPLLGEKLVYF